MNDATTFGPAESSHMEQGTDTGTIETTVDIAASPERVFAALTDPQELAAWWGSDETYRTSDWRIDVRPAGEWSARTIDSSGNEGSIHGEVIVVDAPRVLECTWHASWDEIASTTVRYELSPAIVRDAPGTRLTVTHTGFNGFVACAGTGASYTTALKSVLETLAHAMTVRRAFVSCAA